MKLIKKSKYINVYSGEGMVNKYIYLKRENNQYTMYYIFKIDEILSTSPTIYNTPKCFMLSVPKMRGLKAFVYENVNSIELRQQDELYEMTSSEWLNTFRVFVANEGQYVENLPAKIIQDE